MPSGVVGVVLTPSYARVGPPRQLSAQCCVRPRALRCVRQVSRVPPMSTPSCCEVCVGASYVSRASSFRGVCGGRVTGLVCGVCAVCLCEDPAGPREQSCVDTDMDVCSRLIKRPHVVIPWRRLTLMTSKWIGLHVVCPWSVSRTVSTERPCLLWLCLLECGRTAV